MGSRYGLRASEAYDDEPIWTRGNGYDLRNKSSPVRYQPSQAPTQNPSRQTTTIVHSSIKPVPDSDIYK